VRKAWTALMRRPWLAGTMALLLVVLLVGGIWAANRPTGDDGYVPPAPPINGGGEQTNGGGGQTNGGANAAAAGGGNVPDESSFEEVLTLATDLNGATGAVNTYWAQYFEQQFPGYDYRPPSAITVYRDGEVPDTVCTRDDPPDMWRSNALHCPTDHSLAYSQDWMRKLYDEIGDFAPVVFMFHEFGHHIDHLSGEQQLHTINGELEADCLAGVATQGSMQAGVLHIDDVREASTAMFNAGRLGGRWWKQEDHGTPQQRQAAFAIGYLGNGADCENVGNQPPGLAVQQPPFEIYVVNGSKGDAMDAGFYRLQPPDTTVKVDLEGLPASKLPSTSPDAGDHLEAVWQSWFEQSPVTRGESVTTATISLPDGTQVDESVPDQIRVDGSMIGHRYAQTLDGRPIHGVFMLLVAHNDQDEPVGGLIVDVFDEGDSSAGWEEVNSHLLAIASGLHLK
jgi:predicted metalloprotease